MEHQQKKIDNEVEMLLNKNRVRKIGIAFVEREKFVIQFDFEKQLNLMVISIKAI